MLVMISPSKNMREDECKYKPKHLPVFKETDRILSVLKTLNDEEIKKLMKVNQSITELNIERYKHITYDLLGRPAILTYDGLQYRNIEVEGYSEEECDFLDKHVRILSGLYGVLKPFTSIYPYRLELQTNLMVDGNKNLYEFWGSKLYEEIRQSSHTMINLASNEYSKAIVPYLKDEDNFISCTFKVKKGDSIKVESTASKILRGRMLQYIVKNRITNPEDLKLFSYNNCKFSKEESSDKEYVFIVKR